MYHNGTISYYAARGFRNRMMQTGILIVLELNLFHDTSLTLL
ncbi:MAG: hypothetical protein HPY76_02870 [Anaerolineae bacterium]|nr:hypothetical protein [Anaerolineae bacterium]